MLNNIRLRDLASSEGTDFFCLYILHIWKKVQICATEISHMYNDKWIRCPLQLSKAYSAENEKLPVKVWGHSINFAIFYSGMGGLPRCHSDKKSTCQYSRLETLETRVQSLGQEDPLEEEMVIHSSILAWRIPWTEEPGGLQSMGSQSQTQLRSWTHTHPEVGLFVFLLQQVTCGILIPWPGIKPRPLAVKV